MSSGFRVRRGGGEGGDRVREWEEEVRVRGGGGCEGGEVEVRGGGGGGGGGGGISLDGMLAGF